MRWESMQQVREANEATGQHWFSPSTIRWFNSRIGRTLYGGRYFISSEQPPRGERMWSVREAMPDGTIETCLAFQEFPTRQAAIRAAKSLVGGEE